MSIVTDLLKTTRVSTKDMFQPQTGNICNFSFSAYSNPKMKANKTIYTNGPLHKD